MLENTTKWELIPFVSKNRRNKMEKAKQKFEYLKQEKEKNDTETALYSFLYEAVFPLDILQQLDEAENLEDVFPKIYSFFLKAKSQKRLLKQLYPYLEAKYIIYLTETDSKTDVLTGKEILIYSNKKQEEKEKFFKQNHMLLEKIEQFIDHYPIRIQQEHLKTFQKYKMAIDTYIKEVFPKEDITTYCNRFSLDKGIFGKRLKQMYPHFYDNYNYGVPEYLIDEDGSKEKRFQEFEQFLKTKPTNHIVDAIDFYTITKEKPTDQSIKFQSRTKHSYSQAFYNFIEKNKSREDVSLEELLNGTSSFGLTINGKTKNATQQELVEIYDILVKKEIPVFDKSILAQLRRNWGLNTDIDAKEYLEKNTLK